MTKETQTYRDREDYLKAAVTKRRTKLKQLAIQYIGGKCSIFVVMVDMLVY